MFRQKQKTVQCPTWATVAIPVAIKTYMNVAFTIKKTFFRNFKPKPIFLKWNYTCVKLAWNKLHYIKLFEIEVTRFYRITDIFFKYCNKMCSLIKKIEKILWIA